MDIKQDIISLKKQGVSDHDLTELLVLKGRTETEVKKNLEEYYKEKNATYISHLDPKKEKNRGEVFMLEIIAFLLVVIAAALGYFIYMQLM